MPSQIEPVSRLLGVLLNPQSGPASHSQIETVGETLHAPGFLMHCRENGIAPLVYRGLEETGLTTQLPASVHGAFKRAYYRTLADNLERFSDLREIARVCADRQIDSVVLKGPALIQLLYSDPGLRPMDDLDLLVHPTDLPAFKQGLQGLGFQPVPLYPNLLTRGKTIVDLHTDPINRSRIAARGAAISLNLDALWEQTQPLPTFWPLRTLDLADQLITLAIHALKHGFRQTIWQVDLAACCERVTAQNRWPDVRLKATASRAPRVLSLAFYAVYRDLGAPFSPQTRCILATFPPPGWEKNLLELAKDPGLLHFLEPLVLFKTLEQPQAGVRLLLEMAFPRPEIMHQIMGREGPIPLWWAYFYRFFQLALMGLKCLAMAIRYGLSKKPSALSPARGGEHPP